MVKVPLMCSVIKKQAEGGGQCSRRDWTARLLSTVTGMTTKMGFDNLSGEFWLGLDNIYRLTTKKCNRLRVDLEETTGNTAYAEYDMFAVTNETTKYKLSLGMYSGIALGMYMILIYSILSSFLNYSGVACLFRLAVSCKLENSSKFQKELSYFPNVAPILHFNTRLYSGILLQTFLVK